MCIQLQSIVIRTKYGVFILVGHLLNRLFALVFPILLLALVMCYEECPAAVDAATL